MKTAIRVARAVVSITGLTLVALGVLFWSGHAKSLIPVHMGLGVLFVLALWTLALLSARAGAPAPLVALALVWGLIVPVFGYAHAQVLPGPAHWLIQVLHLLIGMVAMGLADTLERRTSARVGVAPAVASKTIARPAVTRPPGWEPSPGSARHSSGSAGEAR